MSNFDVNQLQNSKKNSPALSVQNLSISFFTREGEVRAVQDVSFDLESGKILGVVGESGSGKTVTCLSILQLLAGTGKIVSGDIILGGETISAYSKKKIRKIRGNRIGMIFQDPMTSLNPLFTVGDQIVETLQEHQKITYVEAKAQAISLLEQVGIPDPEERFSSYPFEFSGGMKQRALIAMALSCRPEILIADEPTTALDVTVQAQILDLLKQLNKDMNMSIIFITHDLAVVASLCEKVIVLYGGRIMEYGLDTDIFYNPLHPYTMGLLKSVPNIVSGEKHKLHPIPGSPPDMLNIPDGCPFYPRCSFAMSICQHEKPGYIATNEHHKAACWLLYDGVSKPQKYLDDRKGVQGLS